MGDRSRPDHWTRRAHDEGYAARSVFKLAELEERFHVIPRGGRVLDLGCSPGSWSAFVIKQAGPGARVVGLDRSPTPDYPGTFVLASVYDVPAATLLEALGGPADLVLSDMAPNTSGNRFADHVQQIELATQAREIALAILAPGGTFVAKVFEGADARGFVDGLRDGFTAIKRLKPKATRTESVEFFVVATGRRG